MATRSVKSLRQIYRSKVSAQKALKDFNNSLKRSDLWCGTKSLSERTSLAAICSDI